MVHHFSNSIRVQYVLTADYLSVSSVKAFFKGWWLSQWIYVYGCAECSCEILASLWLLGVVLVSVIWAFRFHPLTLYLKLSGEGDWMWPWYRILGFLILRGSLSAVVWALPVCTGQLRRVLVRDSFVQQGVCSPPPADKSVTCGPLW